MAFPQVASADVTEFFGGATTTHNVSMPATVDAGDLLLAVVFITGTSTITATGWTEVRTGTTSGNNERLEVLAKVAVGNEGGTTVNFQTSSSAFAIVHLYRISGWFGDIAGVEAAVMATGSGTGPNPPSLTVSWGSDDNLFIAVGAKSTGTVTGAPANFTNLLSGPTNDNMGSARRAIASATQDPGAFSGSTSAQWVATTIGIRPEEQQAEPDPIDLEAFDASPTFYDLTVAAVSVDLAHLDASATFHDPALFDNSVQLGHLDASATFHTLEIAGSVTLDAFDAAPVFHDTEVAGSVTLDAFDASASFHDPIVAAASVDLDPFDASATFHTLSVSGEGIGLAHLAAAATFHTLTVGATTVDLEHLAATVIFHGPLVIPVIVHLPGVGKTAGVVAGARTVAPKRVGVAVGGGQFGVTRRALNVGEVVDPAGKGGS